MTTPQLALTAPPGTYSEIIRGEIKAECARRDISQRGVAALLGLSQPAVSDRWRGRTPWSLNEIERLESVLGLDRGALLFACARRDSNPQPSDLSSLQVLLATGVTACWECRELGCLGEIACDCGCHDEIEEYDNDEYDNLAGLPVFDASASADCFECLEAWCDGRRACACICHDAGVVTPASVWELAA